jgi:hypothetical protein
VKTSTRDDKLVRAEEKRKTREFGNNRDRIAQKLVQQIDEKVMQGMLNASTAKTGGVKLIWCGRLRSAAGNAHWTAARGVSPHNGVQQHNLRVKLSPSIITDEGRPSRKELMQGNSEIPWRTNYVIVLAL